VLFNFVAGQWARFAPAQAAVWVQGLPEGPLRNHALIGLGESWSDVDPAGAAAFAAQLPPGELRQLTLQQAISKWAADNGITYPVLEDADGKVGKAYGARTTPHMFVIGGDGKVLYAGAIDDDPSGRSEAGKRVNHVDAALAAATKGQPIATASTTPYGCAVKYGK